MRPKLYYNSHFSAAATVIMSDNICVVVRQCQGHLPRYTILLICPSVFHRGQTHVDISLLTTKHLQIIWFHFLPKRIQRQNDR
ncbi:hypothetical protein GDO81_006775 [Engystomops pustulosus]|uniref:Uncharacterized protein n=1 Tax=Engystomops pustulosus TaxID=76066 RepID=A0AAV7CZW2_ENGPU|nr:hypothetical protein GDO81_006775 [Engystomops pustulosus]